RQLVSELDEALAGQRHPPEQRAPDRLAGGHLPGFHREIALVLETLRDFRLARGFHLPFHHLPARVQRLVAIQGHQASWVTRRTSSMVVSPDRALPIPSSYIVRMPASRASCSS